MIVGAELDRFLLVIGGLLVFGSVFAWFTDWCRRRGWLEGYTAFFVVAGVLVTEVARLALPFSASRAEILVLTLTCFTASGLPMIVADVVRHLRSRESLVQAERENTAAWEEYAHDVDDEND